MAYTQQQTAVAYIDWVTQKVNAHTTVGRNIAHPFAHHVEQLTLTAFSSCIRESELVTQQWEKDIDSNLAKGLSMTEG